MVAECHKLSQARDRGEEFNDVQDTLSSNSGVVCKLAHYTVSTRPSMLDTHAME